MNETALTKIADQGILGLFVVLLIGAIVFLYKENKKNDCDRLTDMKLVWQEDIKYREEIKTLIQSIKDIILGGKK